MVGPFGVDMYRIDEPVIDCGVMLVVAVLPGFFLPHLREAEDVACQVWQVLHEYVWSPFYRRLALFFPFNH